MMLLRGGPLAAALTIAALATLPLAQARERPVRRHGLDARITGTFAMVARVTTAVGVRGERPGETLHRGWSIVPEHCPLVGNVCRRLILERQRSSHIEQRVVLHRVGRGRYAGSGAFYVGLRCNGRVYRLGSRARFRITLRVTRTVEVQNERFARTIRATYSNPSRTDHTPCPLGPSHDAATYVGHAVSALPPPPGAAYTASINGQDANAKFTDDSKPRPGGARIVARKWFFGDPSSGSANSSTVADPTHRFSAPGPYVVTLVVIDARGLHGILTQAVTVPPPAST
jgi:hypothetical protein